MTSDPRPTTFLSIALTGNIASGKSTVAELFRRWGGTIIDADRLVREAQAPGSPVLGAIVERFGGEVLTPGGELDRAALRSRVMGDPAALADLNRIVHPEVHRRRAALLAEARAAGARIVVSDIPLLFEAADPAEFDAVVLVDAPEEVRRARLEAERGLSREEANRMIAAQLPADPKRARSHYIIDNAGDRAALERAAANVWKALIARA
jgi:dephospho-CoA kinase